MSDLQLSLRSRASYCTSTEAQPKSFTPCFPWHYFLPLYSQPQQAESLTKFALLDRPQFKKYKDNFFF